MRLQPLALATGVQRATAPRLRCTAVAGTRRRRCGSAERLLGVRGLLWLGAWPAADGGMYYYASPSSCSSNTRYLDGLQMEARTTLLHLVLVVILVT